jgi:hypothetical protein
MRQRGGYIQIMFSDSLQLSFPIAGLRRSNIKA